MDYAATGGKAATVYTGFTVAVVIAPEVPEGWVALAGFQNTDGRPWSIQVRYRDPDHSRRRVVVRTTRGSLDWTPVIGTIENVYTVMVNCGARPVEPIVEEPASVRIDGEPVPAVRIACRDGDCALAFDWQGVLPRHSVPPRYKKPSIVHDSRIGPSGAMTRRTSAEHVRHRARLITLSGRRHGRACVC
jgi:hypothetical protein